MKTKRKISVITLTLIVVILIPAVYFTISDSIRINKFHNEFRKIGRNDFINNKIKEFQTLKGTSFLTFENGERIFIPTSGNYLYENEYLDKNLKIGDSLKKYSGSDTITLVTEGRKLYFVIGQLIKRK